MPDVIVKGMEMPPRCVSCPCWTLVPVNGTALDVCNVKDTMIENPFTRPDWCPLEPAPEWISVKDRLPEDGQTVLAYWGNGHFKEKHISVLIHRKGRTAEQINGIGISNCDEWGNNKRPYCWDKPIGPGSYFGQDVTHWLPLPEPPEEVSDV